MAQSSAVLAERAERQRRIHARRDAVAACDLCDEQGYRGRIVCDHIDRTVRHITTAPGAAS